MPPNPRLASSLEELRALQRDGARVFASAAFKRGTRETLLKHGLLQEVMKGWLVSSSSTTRSGDTTPWYASYWEFCTRYCESRFGDAWHVSPEQSLLLHAENSTIPRQVVIYSATAHNDRIELPHKTSFFFLQAKAMPAVSELELRQGVRVFTLPSALVKAAPSFFAQHSIDAHVLLGTIQDPSRLLALLLEGRQSVVGGRLVGALRHVGNTAVADEILAALKSADIVVRVTDPFDDDDSAPAERTSARAHAMAPIVARIRELWKLSRDAVAAEAPPRPRTKPKTTAYLAQIDDIYTLDAYHSLSIEGYQVTSEMIERVATGAWAPDTNESDRRSVDALAARGYWQAFQQVKATAGRILATGDVSSVRDSYRDWYREMFSPHVAVGLFDAKLLAGHRTGPVYLRGSRHVPPRAEIVGEAMAAVFDLIEAEPSTFARAVLGHWLLGYVHPFPDGNGRVARFVMNALLARDGYPWTIIRVEQRGGYLAALEKASVDHDLVPFASFISMQITARAHSSRRSRS
jgi:hypothetical protein